MDYVAPSSLEEAWDALDAEDARCLAGGQSLVAMMNLGLVSPAKLVSLRKISELRGISTGKDGSLRIGAMTTHEELVALDENLVLAQAARVVAYPAIRAFGTIGGAVAHADPAADYPVALVAAQAEIEVRSRKGARRIAAQEFFRGLFETALAAGEIVSAIHVPPPQGRAAYRKLSLVAGDFAILSVAVVGARTVVGGYGPKPILLEEIDAVEPMADQRASSAYRRKVLPELVSRCRSS